MRIELTEPVFPRYVHINSETNQVHLMVPVIDTQDIRSNPTKKTGRVLKEFFDGGALRQLKDYKDKLAFDIRLFQLETPDLLRKVERLKQLEIYIETIKDWQYQYYDQITALMKRNSNFSNIKATLCASDSASKSINMEHSAIQGEDAQFVIHQEAICVDFAELLGQVRADFKGHSIELPDQNSCVFSFLEIEPDVFLSRIDQNELATMPEHVKEACRVHPAFTAHQFLHDIAQGKQEEAQTLLNKKLANTQHLLRTPGHFTDYSGRTFNCTAYEYAYWAKDTRMCRMLERHMDEETKAQMLVRITEMERIDTQTGKKIGLEYQQEGKIHHSAHYELTSLREALQKYVDDYDDLASQRYTDLIEQGWISVGKAQHDLPAHFAQEYCMPGRSFAPVPPFNEETCPRVLTFYNWLTCEECFWFSPDLTPSGLGFKYAVTRGQMNVRAESDVTMQGWAAALDIPAIIHLDEVRTADLIQSFENLKPSSMDYTHKI